MSRARRALSDPSLILTVPGGYAFAGQGRCLVDAEEFATAVRAGGEELAAGRPAVALRCFREALDHWEGQPLAEDAYADWAQDYRGRWRAGTWRPLRARAAAALPTGQPAEAVAAAEQAVTLEPLREASRLLLVEALAASGDQAAALRPSRPSGSGWPPSWALILPHRRWSWNGASFAGSTVRAGQSRPVAGGRRRPAAPVAAPR